MSEDVTDIFEQQQSLLVKMSTPSEFKPEDNELLIFLKSIFKGALKPMNDADSATESLLQEIGHHSSVVREGGEVLPVIGLVINSLDVIRIPMIYLAAFYLKKEVPFTLSNASKFMYAGLLLGLGVASLLVPFAAPIIGLALASVILAAHLVILKGLWDKRKRVDDLPGLIDLEKNNLANINLEAGALLEKLKTEGPLELETQIDSLKEKYDKKVKTIQGLYDEQFELGETSERNRQIEDRRFLTTGAVGVLVGTVIAFLAPAVAPFILIPAMLSGGVYLLGRYVIAPRLMQLRAWFSGHEPDTAVSQHSTVENRSDSTAEISKRIGGGQTARGKQEESPAATSAKESEKIAPTDDNNNDDDDDEHPRPPC